MKNIVLSAMALLAAAASAQAQLININVPNGSFETPALTSSGSPYSVSDSTTIPDWTVVKSDGNASNPVGFANNSALTTPGDSSGNQSAYVQVWYNYTDTTLTSGILADFAANTTYTLSVAIGAPATPQNFDNTTVTQGESAAQADFRLLANGVAISGASKTISETSIDQGTMQDYSLTFTTGASGGVIGQALSIQLEADKEFYPTAASDPGNEAVLFDDVTLTATPEPSTYALMLGGAGFLVLLARRHVRRS